MDTEEIEAYCDGNDWDSWCEEAEARAGASDGDDSFDSYGFDTEEIEDYCADPLSDDESWCEAARAAREGSSSEEEEDWSSTEEEEEGDDEEGEDGEEPDFDEVWAEFGCNDNPEDEFCAWLLACDGADWEGEDCEY